MAQESNVINLVCSHPPYTSQMRVKCKPPDIVFFSSCEECAKRFAEICVQLGGEIIKPKMVL